MSDHLSAGGVVQESLEFGLHRWGTVLRYAWAPILVAGLLAGGAFGLAAAAVSGGKPLEDPGVLMEAALSLGPLIWVIATVIVLSVLFLMSGVYASIFDLVADGRDRRGLIHLRTDGPACRTFAAYLLMTAIGLAIWSLALLAAQFVAGVPVATLFKAIGDILRWSAAAGEGAEPPPAVIRADEDAAPLLGVALLLGLVPQAYAAVKLTPLPAIAAIENRLAPRKAFAMTAGSFWSILGAYALFLMALALITIVFDLAVGVLDLMGGFLVGGAGAAALAGFILSAVVLFAQIVYQAFSLAVQGAFVGVMYRRLAAA